MSEITEEAQQISDLLHELRQPLNRIVLTCNNILNRAVREGGGIDQEFLVRKMNGIMDAIKVSADIIDRIEGTCNRHQ